MKPGLYSSGSTKDTSCWPCLCSFPARSSSSSTIWTLRRQCPSPWPPRRYRPGSGPSAPTIRSRSVWAISGKGSGCRTVLRARKARAQTARPVVQASAQEPRRCRARSVTRQAPCLSRLLVPAERGSSGLPGTAKTSRPCSPANRAVISEPERSAASTTTTPSEMPEIRRLRRGKSLPLGAKPGLSR